MQRTILCCDICGTQIKVGAKVMMYCTGMDEEDNPVIESYCVSCANLWSIHSERPLPDGLTEEEM